MKYVLNKESTITSIINAVEEKSGEEDVSIKDVANIIANLPSGGGGVHEINCTTDDFYFHIGGINRDGYMCNPIAILPDPTAENYETVLALYNEVIEYVAAGYQVQLNITDNYDDTTVTGTVIDIFDYDSEVTYLTRNYWADDQNGIMGAGFIATIISTDYSNNTISFPLLVTKGTVSSHGGT